MFSSGLAVAVFQEGLGLFCGLTCRCWARKPAFMATTLPLGIFWFFSHLKIGIPPLKILHYSLCEHNWLVYFTHNLTMTSKLQSGHFDLIPHLVPSLTPVLLVVSLSSMLLQSLLLHMKSNDLVPINIIHSNRSLISKKQQCLSKLWERNAFLPFILLQSVQNFWTLHAKFYFIFFCISVLNFRKLWTFKPHLEDLQNTQFICLNFVLKMIFLCLRWSSASHSLLCHLVLNVFQNSSFEATSSLRSLNFVSLSGFCHVLNWETCDRS